MKIVAAADGSALGNPGPAGWGWYIDDDHWASGGWPRGTNNMGELMAVLDLLRQTRGVSELEVLCDSQYVINSVTKWMPGWKRKGWKKADGKPVLNVDLLKEIDKEMAGRSVTFTWIKGHSGHSLNDAADRKANGAAQKFARGEGGNEGPGYRQAGTPEVEEKSRAAEPDGQEDLFSGSGAERALPLEAPFPSEEDRSDEQQVLRLERQLMDPAVRADRGEAASLLHADMQEIGSSGRLWGREDLLAAMEGEAPGPVPEVDVLTTRDLAPGLIQIVYRATEEDRAVLRTSLWLRAGGRWQMIWHQGTEESAGL